MAKFKNLFFTFLITLSIGFYSCDEDVPVEAGNLTEEDIQNAFDQAKAEKEGGRTDEKESNSDDTNNDNSDSNDSGSGNSNTNEEITISTEGV